MAVSGVTLGVAVAVLAAAGQAAVTLNNGRTSAVATRAVAPSDRAADVDRADRAERLARTVPPSDRRTGSVPSANTATRAQPSPPKPSPKPPTKPKPAWVRPARDYDLTSGFGQRWGTLHAGVDLAGPTGTPIYAARSGTVETASWYGGYGYAVIIKHDNGVSTLYGHNSRLLVRDGQRVATGERISLMGSTGDSTGSHLHFEVHVGGDPVDPVPWMRARGVRL